MGSRMYIILSPLCINWRAYAPVMPIDRIEWIARIVNKCLDELRDLEDSVSWMKSELRVVARTLKSCQRTVYDFEQD